MIQLKDMKINRKLVLFFLLVGIVPLGVLGYLGADRIEKALMKKTYDQLEAVREIKKNQIQRYFDERKGDITVLTEMVEALRENAFEKLQTAQQLKKTHVEDFFKQIHSDIGLLAKIDKARTLLESAGGDAGPADIIGPSPLETKRPDAWRSQRAERTFFTDFAESRGYYDIFLINPSGEVVFSVAREKDLGTNLETGPYKEEGLARLWREVKEKGGIAYQDYAPYTPSQGEYAAFVGAPVQDAEGSRIGVVAFQIPKDPLQAIVSQRQGMGQTGETYLVGRAGDRIEFRSDLYTMAAKDRDYKLGEAITTSYIERAMSGETGQEVYTDSLGTLVMAAYAPLDIQGLEWACVSKIDLQEAITPGETEAENGFFARYAQVYGYYDLFLIHPKGRIFFSVLQEADYGTNILTGEYADSALGRLTDQVLETEKFAMADFAPYPPSDNKPAAFIATPLMGEGGPQLVVALQLSVTAINTIMQERNGMGETGETYLVGPDHLMRSDSFLEKDSHTVEASFANPQQGSVKTDAAKAALAGESDQKVIADYNGEQVLSAYTPVSLGEITWALLAEMNLTEVRKPVNEVLYRLGGMVLVLAVLVFAVAFWLARGISRPISQGVSFAQEVAQGQLNTTIAVVQKDEIGVLAESLRGMVTRLRQIVTEVKMAADNVASGSNELSASAEGMSQGVSEQAASAEEASASMEEMVSNIRQNSDNAMQTEKIAMRSAQDAEESGQAVSEAVDAMNTIAEKIGIVEEIARQTDLLALNAAIEAARAGDHGRGFAVVAAEVRKLAERSQTAAAEINKLASSSVQVAARAGEMLKQLVPDIRKTAELVQEIAAASNEQNTGADQINRAVQQLDQVIQQNATVSEEMASTAEELAGQAESLRHTIDYFEVEENEPEQRGGSEARGQEARDTGKGRGARAAKPGQKQGGSAGQKPLKSKEGEQGSLDLAEKNGFDEPNEDGFERY